MKRVIGNIPAELVYFARPPHKATFSWDELSTDDIKPVEVGTVRAVYVSDAANKKTMETGAAWALQREWNQQENEASKQKKYETKYLKPNRPFKIKILSLEHRGNGGRAYKVVTDENFYVDLREDVLLDVIRNASIVEGRPDCEFIWGKVGSEMKLVRVESDLHKALEEANQYDLKDVVKVKDLVVGDVYRDKQGGAHVFLGWVETYKLTQTSNGRTYRYGETNRVGSIEKVKTMAWFGFPTWKKDWEKLTMVQYMNEEKTSIVYYTDFRKSLSFKEKIAHKDVPHDMLDRVRRAAMESSRSHEKQKQGQVSKGNVAYNYEKIWMRPAGAPDPQLPPEFKLTVGEELGY